MYTAAATQNSGDARHNYTCRAGEARTSVRAGNASHGIAIANEMAN